MFGSTIALNHIASQDLVDEDTRVALSTPFNPNKCGRCQLHFLRDFSGIPIRFLGFDFPLEGLPKIRRSVVVPLTCILVHVVGWVFPKERPAACYEYRLFAQKSIPVT